MAVVEYNGWEMIVNEAVVNDPVEYRKISAALKMISEIEVVDAV